MKFLKPENREAKHFIYGLVCPVSNRIKYVGRSINPNVRYNAHCTTFFPPCNRSSLQRWIWGLAQCEMKPYLVILQESLNWWTVGDAEKSWIHNLKSIGFNLLNGNRGGKGGPCPNAS